MSTIENEKKGREKKPEIDFLTSALFQIILFLIKKLPELEQSIIEHLRIKKSRNEQQIREYRNRLIQAASKILYEIAWNNDHDRNLPEITAVCAQLWTSLNGIAGLEDFGLTEEKLDIKKIENYIWKFIDECAVYLNAGLLEELRSINLDRYGLTEQDLARDLNHQATIYGLLNVPVAEESDDQVEPNDDGIPDINEDEFEEFEFEDEDEEDEDEEEIKGLFEVNIGKFINQKNLYMQRIVTYLAKKMISKYRDNFNFEDLFKSQESPNFTDLDLSGVDFSTLDLTGVNFSNCNLKGADFTNADLTGAILSGANLTGAILSGANLTNTKFASNSSNKQTIMDGVIAIKTDFRVIDNKYSALIGVSFREANLTQAKFRLVGLSGANFENATLLTTTFEGANLNGANFCEANLEGAYFGAYYNQEDNLLILTKLQNSSFSGAYLKAANFTNADLTGANFSRTNEKCTTNLRQADFTEANLTGANLSSSKLFRAKFTKANLTGANFANTDLAEADLHNAIIYNTNFTGSIIKSLNKGIHVAKIPETAIYDNVALNYLSEEDRELLLLKKSKKLLQVDPFNVDPLEDGFVPWLVYYATNFGD